MDNQHISKDLLTRYFAGSCTEKEKEQVLAYLSSMDSDVEAHLMEQEWLKLENDAPSRNREREQINYSIISKAVNSLEKSKLSTGQLFYRIAASLIFITATVALFLSVKDRATEFFQPIRQVEVATKPGKVQLVSLPDGSSVWLNASSKLIYPERFKKTREVILEGEAFFSVKRDEEHPFIISTGTCYTSVLGTSFNIKAYKEDAQVDVTVATGKVAVSAAADSIYEHAEKLALLTANQQIEYFPAKHSFITSEIEANDFKSWIDGELVFKKASVLQLAATLERWFGVKVKVTGFVSGENCTFTGYFKNKTTLDDVLSTFSFTGKFQYTISGQQVIIDVGKCIKK